LSGISQAGVPVERLLLHEEAKARAAPFFAGSAAGKGGGSSSGTHPASSRALPERLDGAEVRGPGCIQGRFLGVFSDGPRNDSLRS
jgi:hypothetical protein